MHLQYLAKGSHNIPDLRHGDLAVTPGVIKEEGFLELSNLILAEHTDIQF